MDLLKAQLDRLQKQLAGLNATQKMLTAALAAIMVITVVWWGKYAGEAEMVPLLNQTFSPADLGRIEERLDQRGIHYSVSGEKIMLPADRRMEVLSDLTYSRLMPHNTQQGFDEMLKQMSPFDPEDKQAKLWNHGKEMLLSQIIGTFPDVVRADVIIDSTSKQRIEGSIEPSATINIGLRDGVKSSQALVDAAADTVAGAESGLNAARIKVVVNGLAQRVHDSEDAVSGGDQQLALLQQHEASVEQKVRQAYSDIPGLLVSVRMKLNTTTLQVEKHDFDGKGTVQKAIESTTETDQTSGPPAGGGEAGAVSNTGVSVANSGVSAVSQSHEKSNDKFTVMVPETKTLSRTPAGDATPIGAAVRVPLSYFSRMMQAINPSTKDPTYAQLKPLIDDELTKMRENVARCVALTSPNEVSIDTYVDAAPVMAAAPIAAASGSGLSLMVGGHAKELALGVLAVMSLFMASMMVRKATPSPVAAAPAKPESEKQTVLTVGEALAGEASSTDAMLDGMELNEEAVKTNQMVEQVSTLVRENPDAAAALVKRWLNRA